MSKPLSVRQFDSVLRYMVRSETSKRTEYLVELDAFNGIGRCMCDHFQYRCEPILNEETTTERIALRCKHILAAREYALDQFIAKLATAAKSAGRVEADRRMGGNVRSE